jgi:SAM-dependent methyltransferase
MWATSHYRDNYRGHPPIKINAEKEIPTEMFPNWVRKLTPKWVRILYRRLWGLPNLHQTYRTLSVADTFRTIYRTKAWGDNGEAFCSGSGSGGPASEQYYAGVIEFISHHQVQSVVDLGCGDFAVGRKIVEASGVRYTGIDVVPELIEHHKQTVHDPRVSFQCADITCDPLPLADLCLIRQVLQHLSNDEIAKVLANVRNFPRILVSEDVPVHPKALNRDKPHGPDVRRYYGSGVYVDQPPFSMPAQELWSFRLEDGAVLRTVLLDQAGAQRGNGKSRGNPE